MTPDFLILECFGEASLNYKGMKELVWICCVCLRSSPVWGLRLFFVWSCFMVCGISVP